MSYLINKKFMFLLSKFRELNNTEKIENELDKIQNIKKRDLNLNNISSNDKKRKLKDLFDLINEDNKIIQSSTKNNLYKSKLLITSDDENNEDDDGFITVTKKYKNNIKQTSKINNKNTKSLTNLDTSKLLIVSDDEDDNINIKEIEVKKVNSKKYGNIYLDNLSNDKNIILISYLKTKIDVLSYLCFECLSDEIYIMQTKDKINTIKEYKLDCISIFNIENLFKTCNFTSKECKKSDLDDVFTNNKAINKSMLKVIGAVLNINIIYLKNDEKEFLNVLKDNRATILIIEHNEMLFTVKKKSGFIRGNELEKYGVIIKRTYSKESLEKMKLEDIQNIANSLNIDIKKDGKTGKINKKKEELIENII